MRMPFRKMPMGQMSFPGINWSSFDKVAGATSGAKDWASMRPKTSMSRVLGSKQGRIGLAVGGGALVLGAAERARRSSGRMGPQPMSSGGSTLGTSGIYNYP